MAEQFRRQEQFSVRQIKGFTADHQNRQRVVVRLIPKICTELLVSHKKEGQIGPR